MTKFGSLFLTISTLAYVILGVNVLVTAACLPLIGLLLLTDIRQSWLLLGLLSPLAAPAATGAFTVFKEFNDDGSAAVLRAFGRGWRRPLARSLPIGAAVAAVLLIVTVDLIGLSGTRIGAVTMPVFLVLAALAILAGLTALVALVDDPAIRRRDALLAGLLRCVRSPLTLVTLVAAGMFLAFFHAAPAYALGLALAPVLYLAWANARHALGVGQVAERAETAASSRTP
ncbi:MAG: hypothetical protein LBM23_08940 [Propionibacteriaceae bacterium]|jgi:uncharacterized membrane protein YesL|nr:hypothetical protein [Propionibacteriaceae bacterium]